MTESDSEKAEHEVGAILGHEENVDPYGWSFEIKWKNYNEQGFDLLNGFMVDGAWKVENMVANYLTATFEGSKRLVKQKLNGETKYSVWPVVKTGEEANCKQLNEVCCAATNRAMAGQYLASKFPHKKLVPRYDRYGKLMGYVVADKA